MESICALIFTLILMFPLIIQLQMLIMNPKKLCSVFHYYATQEEGDNPSSPRLLQFYPKESQVIEKSSNSKLMLASLRTVSSSPAMASGLPIAGEGESTASRIQRHSGFELSEARYSSTFLKTDVVLPVVDITWTYSSYRFKTFESCLRDHYGSRYPPGEVVLNSMQLNLLDSRTNVGPGVAGLFDFVKDSEPALNGLVSKKLEIEYLDPLGHFVTRRLCAPSTEERFTETSRGKTDEDSTRPISDAINEREKNAGRSGRKIELPCKRDPTTPRRVCATNDYYLREGQLTLEDSTSVRTKTTCNESKRIDYRAQK